MSTTAECDPGVTICRTVAPVEPRQPLGPRSDVPVPVVAVATTVPAVMLPTTGGGGFVLASALLALGVGCVLVARRRAENGE